MVAERTRATADEAPDLSTICLAISDRAPFPMAAVEGAQHIVRYVNPALCQLLGKDEEELIGKPFTEVMAEGSRCLALLDRVYRTGQPENYTEPEGSAPRSP